MTKSTSLYRHHHLYSLSGQALNCQVCPDMLGTLFLFQNAKAF
ncbi:hypothetical protein [Chlorogloeopsis fritschii]|nr:hypothetical protein [Chlorogloeopsis fritschii]